MPSIGGRVPQWGIDGNLGADDHALEQRRSAKGTPVLRPAAANKNIARHGDRAVGDDEDIEGDALERVAFGDAINLLLYGQASALT
jgi:hypothetical protein